MKELLTIEDLSLAFKGAHGPTRVLNQVSLRVRQGETVALVGESGSGKSVTALSILQLLERESITASGRILFAERGDLLALPEAEMREVRGNRIAMIFQEPMTSLNPVYTIGDQLIEPIMLHQKLPRESAREYAIDLMRRSGIQDPKHRLDAFPHQLSGGQRQRVMIAMALACKPSLLIADEPTTALDVTIQAQILSLIKDIQQDMGMAVLLITHDLNMVRKVADRVAIMNQGAIVEEGETETIFDKPQHPYTIHLMASVPHGLPADKEPSEPIVEVKHLRCHFPIKAGFFRRTVGTVRAVDNVTLAIREGTTFGLVGESGSGKTTLGLAILRLVSSQGQIRYRDYDLTAFKNRQLRPLRRELQVVFQDPYSSLSPRMTVEQIVGEGLVVHKIGKDRHERRALVEQALAEVGLTPEMADRYPHEFSGGQRQRIAIARAVVLEPSFLVLDEPTSALDMTIQAQIIDLLKRLQQTHGMTYLFISHDLRTVRALADDVAVMQNGRIVESGPAAQVFARPRHPYTKTLFSAAFNYGA
ncbi:MAG: ABC transporter ATP-binding protein [Thermodesulfobacteriota bacterium]